MKKIISLLLIMSISISLAACKESSGEKEKDGSKIYVSVTFDALAEFTKAVGQDKVDVATIIPAGTEPHDFEPKAADIARLSDSEVFVYNGLGMEAWAEETIIAAENNSLTVVLASEHADTLKNSVEEADEHGAYDPHLWLSIKGAQTQVRNIADGLASADPENKAFYEKNADSYIAELETLFQEYKGKFDSLENKNFVTGHAAFNYFCRDFGLVQNSVADIFAEGEPGTKQLADLVDYCRENNVTTIFAEETGNADISRTLAKEVGADVQTIYTMENPEDGKTYLERMRDNCLNVYESLSGQ